MAAKIVSTPSFAGGALVQVAHNTAVADDGLVQVAIQYACLGTPQVVAANMRRFLPDAPPPLPLPPDLAALRLEGGTVYLTESRPTVLNGICYIDATYVGSSADQARRVTETWTTRSFSGEILGAVQLNTGTIPAIYGTISFDYTGVSRTVSWTFVEAQVDVALQARPLNIRNRREVSFGTANVIKRGVGYMVEQVPSISTAKVGRVTRVTKTVTGEYVSDNDGLVLLREDRRSGDVNLAPIVAG